MQIGDKDILLLRLAATVIAVPLWSLACGSAQAQTTYLYGGGNKGSWISAVSWTGNPGHTPGVDANANTTTDGAITDVASIKSSSTIQSVGINFNTGTGDGNSTIGAANQSLSLGAVTFVDGDGSGTFTIGNNSTNLSGTLTLNGVTMGVLQNVILQNASASTLTLANAVSSGTKNMDVGLGNAMGNVIEIDGSGSIFISSAVTGLGRNLTKEGSGMGSLILAGLTPNTFSGATIINAGSLSAQTTGSLGSTSGITVNNGGTLLLTGSVTNRINDTAGLTLAGGGVLKTSGFKEGKGPSAPTGGAAGAVGIGALTLQGSSASLHATIDFAAGANGSALVFSSLAGSGYLDVLNWTGVARGDDGTSTNDRLLFGTDPGLTDAQLANVMFYNDNGAPYAAGGTIIPYGNEYEIVPVPEPATFYGGFLLAATTILMRRWWRKLADGQIRAPFTPP